MVETAILEENDQPKSTLRASERIATMPRVYQSDSMDTFGLEAARPIVATDTAMEKPLFVDAPLPVSVRFTKSEGASLIQIWEGTVEEIVPGDAVRARLRAKMGDVSDHFADIGLEWVNEQDRALVKPGAVFYLTVYKARRSGGTIVNSQELRFRRLPAWTARDAASAADKARTLLTKGEMGRTAP